MVSIYIFKKTKTAYRDSISRFHPEKGGQEGYPFTFVKSKPAKAKTNYIELSSSLFSCCSFLMSTIGQKKTGLPVTGKPVVCIKKYNMASPLTEESVAPPKPY